MARRPDGNRQIAQLRRSVFSQLAPRIRQHKGPIYPLHVGDTYLPPPPGAHLSDQSEARHPRVHRYENPRGATALLDAIVRHRARIGDPQAATPDNVLVTAGATGALATGVRALLEPGEALLVLAPYWPLIRGMSTSHGIDVVEVPFYDRVHTAAEATAALERARVEHAAAVYVNWPNNPSGVVAPAEVVGAVVDFALRHDLWIFADEVYEDYVFEGDLSRITDFPEARDRTVRAFSFSKAYAMAGNRVGYAIAAPEVASRLEQLATYLVYSVNTAAQHAAAVALDEGAGWMQSARQAYRDAARRAADRLGVPSPAGGTFLFVDVAAHLDERGVLGLLEDCLAEGLLLSPGDAFGQAYGPSIRLCFTSAAPEAVDRGVEILARRLGR